MFEKLHVMENLREDPFDSGKRERQTESCMKAFRWKLDNLVSVHKSSMCREYQATFTASESESKKKGVKWSFLANLESDDDYISSSDLKAGEDLKTTKKKDIPTVIKDETNSLVQTEKQKGGGDGGRARDNETDKQQGQQEQKKQWELRKRSATKHKCTRVAADSKVLSSVKLCKPTTWMMMILYLFVLVASADADCKIGEDPKCPISRNIPTRAVVKGDSISIGSISGHEIKSYNLFLSVSEATPKGLKWNNCSVLYLLDSNSTGCPGLEYEKKDANETHIILLSVQKALTFNLAVEGINYFANFFGVVLVSDVTCPTITTTPPAIQLWCDQNHNATEGTVCKFSCLSGFEGKGDAQKTCLPNGTWTSTNFTCEEVPPASSNDDKSSLGLTVAVAFLGSVVIILLAFICIKKKQEYKRAQVSAVQSALRTVLVYTDNPQTRKSSRESGADELPRSRSSTF